jgi:hypothetical protein
MTTRIKIIAPIMYIEPGRKKTILKLFFSLHGFLNLVSLDIVQKKLGLRSHALEACFARGKVQTRYFVSKLRQILKRFKVYDGFYWLFRYLCCVYCIKCYFTRREIELSQQSKVFWLGPGYSLPPLPL